MFEGLLRVLFEAIQLLQWARERVGPEFSQEFELRTAVLFEHGEAIAERIQQAIRDRETKGE